MSNSLNEKQVLCPHCWHQFYPDQALYIATHPELYGDDVLGQNENTRYAPSQVQKDRTGIAKDPMGGTMTERACPTCHLQIPPELLIQAGKILSMVGAPASGKTYFLTSMLHELRRELVQKFGLTLRDSDSHEVKVFLDFESTLFASSAPDNLTQLSKTFEAGSQYNIVKINGKDFQLPKPLMFSLSPSLSNPDKRLSRTLQVPIVLYDNAGESFEFLEEKKTGSRVTQHLSKSEAIFFIFDPALDASTRQKLQSESDDPQVSPINRVPPIRNGGQETFVKPHRQETLLTELINRIRRQRGLPSSHLIPAPLLVCVQKYDIWKSLMPCSKIISKNGTVTDIVDDSSVVFSEKLGIAGLDIDEINRIGLLVRAFLEDSDPTFVELAESNFQTVRYFPVSALGTSPEVDEDVVMKLGYVREALKVRPNKIAPFRVTHPVLWLLLRWKLIRPLNKRAMPTNIPHAVASFDRRSGKMRVTLPSKRILMLDLEYSEMVIVDPYSEQFVWIPKIEVDTESSSSDQTRKSEPVKSVAPMHSLKLQPPAPQPAKRGWFKK
ncbi:MAG: hypothetical protein SGI77_06405 [Pirellulaceae bacterium]|nr:hypothetical protein [Pirellulaceae bacterium]